MKKIVEDTIYDFIKKMGYLENRHVIGILFYGSYQTGYNHPDSDIDLHVIFDNFDPKHLIRGIRCINGIRIEYFEKPIGDVRESIDDGFLNQNNAYLSIIGQSIIILDKSHGALEMLQEYATKKFDKPLPPISEDEIKEKILILDNRMRNLEIAANTDRADFDYLYYLTAHKLREFYHDAMGWPDIPTSKEYRIYSDEKYRKAMNKEAISVSEFIDMFLKVITDSTSDKITKFNNIGELYKYIRDTLGYDSAHFDSENCRVKIQSRNDPNFRRRG